MSNRSHRPPYSPDEPIATYIEGASRTRSTCNLCQKPISKGDEAVTITLFHVNLDRALTAHAACFRASPWEENYRERHLSRAYDISDFDGEELFWHETYRDLLAHFSFDRAARLLAAPVAKSSTELSVGSSPGTLFDALYFSGFGDELRARMKALPPHTQVFFALHDDRRFQIEASRLFDVPLGDALDRLRKQRLTLADVLFVDDVGARSAPLRAAIANAIETYFLASDDYCLVSPGFAALSRVKWAQVVNFFVSNVAALPLLADVVASSGASAIRRDETATPKDAIAMYAACYFERAGILSLARSGKDLDDIATWFDELEENISYYPAGTPRGFINDTKKMVAGILRANPTLQKAAQRAPAVSDSEDE